MTIHPFLLRCRAILLLPALLLCTAVSHAQLTIVYPVSQYYRFYAPCVNCSIQTPQNAVGNNWSDFSLLTAPAINDITEQTLVFPAVTAGVFNRVIFRLGFNGRISRIASIRNVRIETLNGNISNNDERGLDSLLTIIQPDSQRISVSLIPAKKFDRVKVRIVNTGPNETNHVRIFDVYHSSVQISRCAAGVPTNPLAYYPFDGNLRDSTGNGYHGTGQDINYLTGLACGQGAYFWPVGNAKTTVNNIPLPTQAVTFAFWVERTLVPNAGFILNSPSYSIDFTNPNVSKRLSFTAYGLTANGGTYVDAFQSDTERKMHIACTYDGSTMTIYKNGELVAAAPYTSTPRPGNFFYVTAVNCIVDELLLYDRSIPPSDIKNLYLSYNYNSSRTTTDSTKGIIQPLECYPNPTNGLLRFKGNFPAGSTVIISDLNGQQLYHTAVLQSGIRLPATLPSGTYIVRLRTRDQQTYAGKIVLNH